MHIADLISKETNNIIHRMPLVLLDLLEKYKNTCPFRYFYMFIYFFHFSKQQIRIV